MKLFVNSLCAKPNSQFQPRVMKIRSLGLNPQLTHHKNAKPRLQRRPTRENKPQVPVAVHRPMANSDEFPGPAIQKTKQSDYPLKTKEIDRFKIVRSPLHQSVDVMNCSLHAAERRAHSRSRTPMSSIPRQWDPIKGREGHRRLSSSTASSNEFTGQEKPIKPSEIVL